MEKVLEYLNIALQWLNNPTVKYGLGIVGGYLWTKHPNTVNRAYPFIAMTSSVLLSLATVISTFLAGLGDGNQQAAFVAITTVSAPALVVDVVLGTVLPVIAAVGTHSWWKNLLQWLSDGYRLRKES